MRRERLDRLPSMRRALVALLVLSVGALLLLWRSTLDVDPTRALSGPELGTAASADAESRTRRTTDPGIRLEAGLPQGATKAKPGVEVPLEERSPELVEDATFAAKYADWSKAQLEARTDEVEQVHLSEIERLCDLRFESGLYRVVDADEVEGIDGSYDVLAAVDQQGVISRARAVFVPDSSGAPPDSEHEGHMEHQLVTLPPEVYPDLYRQRAELEWLRATLALRRANGEDPP